MKNLRKGLVAACLGVVFAVSSGFAPGIENVEKNSEPELCYEIGRDVEDIGYGITVVTIYYRCIQYSF